MAREPSTPRVPPDLGEGWLTPEPIASAIERWREAEGLHEALARQAAEFQNSRRRLEREYETRLDRHLDAFLERLLLVLDDLDRALGSAPGAPPAERFVEGVRLIREKILDLLRQEGVTEIPAEGTEFDPGIHEAVAVEDRADLPSNRVVEVFRKGYARAGRTLRAAQVRVSRRGPAGGGAGDGSVRV